MKRKSHEEYKAELKQNKKDTITLLSKYTSSRCKVRVKCNKCGYIWDVSPRTLLGKSGCPSCGKIKAKKTMV
jgi:rubrerythrin